MNRKLHVILLVMVISVIASACAPSVVTQTQAPVVPQATQVPAATEPPACTNTLCKLQTTKYALLASYNEPPHDWFDSTDGKWKGVDNDVVEYILPKLGVEMGG